MQYYHVICLPSENSKVDIRFRLQAARHCRAGSKVELDTLVSAPFCLCLQNGLGLASCSSSNVKSYVTCLHQISSYVELFFHVFSSDSRNSPEVSTESQGEWSFAFVLWLNSQGADLTSGTCKPSRSFTARQVLSCR